MECLLMFISFCSVIYYNGNIVNAEGKYEVIEDAYRNVSEIIASKGYPVEDHIVKTSDGYLLSVQRIPHGRNGNIGKGKKELVLLIHGILGDAGTWVLNFPDQSLGFILPDQDYDVWMLNTRGCDNSRSHVTYNTNQYQFWNFSFNELAQNDIPATIDYILKVTGKEALHIIGYSQGFTGSLAMLSEIPDYNNKVKLFIGLAPVAYFGHTTSAFRKVLSFKYELFFLNRIVSHGALIQDNRIIKDMIGKFCTVDELKLCKSILVAFGGIETKLNKTRLGVYTPHVFISSTSSKSFVHYGQLLDSKKFRKYDYGSRLNLMYYNQGEPPEYQISRITTPVALIWSTDDAIADKEDVEILQRILNSLIFDYQVPDLYSHYDFVLADSAVELIYKPILQLLAKY